MKTYPNRKKFASSFIILALFGTLTYGFVDSYYFKVNKSFEIFGDFFRNISSNYVNEVDPDELMKYAMEGILNNLDPYSDYYEPDDKETLDLITNGKYTGLGITVNSINNRITVYDLQEGFSAQKNGLKIGDVIYKIDSTIVIGMTNKDLRPFTQGAIGSVAHVSVIREGVKDTIQLTIPRQEITISNISYYGFVNDSIGYLKLDRFTRDSDEDFSNCMKELSNSGKLKGMIIDLRDNPGGVLESAVNICSLFLPRGSTIVSTKGRLTRNNVNYVSQFEPAYPNLPLTVLINEGSASASEIVAGAIQDLDRGVLIGFRSFGKGLVQSVFDLPYNSSLKLTTAKYYTPSGRCIQKIEYNKKLQNKAETGVQNTFYTKNGRKVREQLGINPDYQLDRNDTNLLVNELVRKDLIFLFVSKFSVKNKVTNLNFHIDDKTFNEFKTFLNDQKFTYQSPELKKLSEIEDMVKKSKYSDETLTNVTILENSLKKDKNKVLNDNKERITSELEKEIKRRFFTSKQITEFYLKTDDGVKESIKHLVPKDYNRMLAKEKENKGDN